MGSVIWSDVLTALDRAYQECYSITRREAKNFYYAFLTLPSSRRKAIYMAYAFCRHCDDSVDRVASVEEKLTALCVLKQKLHDAYAGRANEAVFLALADAAERYDIPSEYFHEVISGVESDLIKNRYENFEQLRRYCYQVASVIGLICLQIFGCKDATANVHAVDLGLAMQLTNIARDVKEDLGFDRIYLPLDEIARFGYSEAELRAGVVNESFTELMRFQSQRAKHYFRRGFQLLPYLSRSSRACPAVLGQLYRKVLEGIESVDYDVLHHRVSLSAQQKIRVTSQTWLSTVLPFFPPARGY